MLGFDIISLHFYLIIHERVQNKECKEGEGRYIDQMVAIHHRVLTALGLHRHRWQLAFSFPHIHARMPADMSMVPYNGGNRDVVL